MLERTHYEYWKKTENGWTETLVVNRHLRLIVDAYAYKLGLPLKHGNYARLVGKPRGSAAGLGFRRQD